MRISDWSSDVCSSDLAARGSCCAPAVSSAKSGRCEGHDRPLRGHEPSRADAPPDQNGPSSTCDTPRVIYIGRYFRSMNAQTTLRSEEHTSELQSLMRISYAVFCLKKQK